MLASFEEASVIDAALLADARVINPRVMILQRGSLQGV